MLQNIRDRFTGGFALALLALICVPFLFFGITNYDFLGSSYAAKVNGDEVSLGALDNAYRQQLAQYSQGGGELPDELRNAIKENVLNGLIGETLVNQYLASAGYRISDQMITDVIQGAPEFQVDGKFSKDTYYTWLSQRGQTPTSFEEFERYQMRLNQLQRGVAGTGFVTPAEYRRYLNLYGEERNVAIATFDIESVADTIEVSDEDIQSYYDERPDAYSSPESVDLRYIEIRRDELRDQAEVTDTELQKYYDDSRNRYLQDERRRARHILIPIADDEDAAKAQATALAERARAGEPLADLARQYSADGGTAEQGGDLGLLPRSQLPAELGSAIFSMQKGEIAGPVRTDFGFHVIGLEEVVAGGPLPFADVKSELELELRNRKADEAWTRLEKKVSDALFDATDIDTLGSQVDIPVQSADGFTRSGGAGFGRNQAAIDAVFESSVLNDGRISDMIELDANRAIVAQVSDHHVPQRKPLEDVRESIVTALKNDRANDIVNERATELTAAVQGGTEFAEAAKSADADNVTTSSIKRQDGEVDANIRNAVFELKKPAAGSSSVGSVRTSSGDMAVFAVTSVTPGRPEAIPVAERDEGKSNLAGQAGNADYAALVLELQQRADIVRNKDALNQQNLF